MKAVIQRVKRAGVRVEGNTISEIETGLVILLGIAEEDESADIDWLTKKIANLRIFQDEQGVMNRSLLETGGEAIIVSQFTLLASTKKGNRPSYIQAAKPEMAVPMYESFVQQFEELLGKKVGTGVFGADMEVSLNNDGPVTIVIDSRNRV